MSLQIFCLGWLLNTSSLLQNRNQLLNASVVAMETMRDPVLGKALQFTQQGWPDNLIIQIILVVVDAYSKFLKIVPMTHATSTNTITALRHIMELSLRVMNSRNF